MISRRLEESIEIHLQELFLSLKPSLIHKNK